MNLNPIHEAFLEYGLMSSLATLLRVLDDMNPKLRDATMQWTYFQVVRPAFDIAPEQAFANVERYKHDTIRDHMDMVNYRLFKDKCSAVADQLDEYFLVNAIVGETAAWLARNADPAKIALRRESLTRDIDRITGMEQLETEQWKTDQLSELLAMLRTELTNLEANTARSLDHYNYFCQSVIQPLMEAGSA